MNWQLLLATSTLVSTGFFLTPKPASTPKHPHFTSNPVFVSDAEKKWVENELSTLTVREQVAQSFMIPCWSNRGQQHLDEVEKIIRDEKIGGVIFFQGERENLQAGIAQFQQASIKPLLIGMDAEWGVAMRLFDEARFPYQQTIGAANDTDLTQKMGFFMGLECESLGIHLNFSPVADVNSNPSNPVIGFRSFGANANDVAKHTAAMIKGIEETGVISSIKHFPGHGDTDKDSHLELPTVSHSEQQFNTTDFVPFEAGIKAGARSVMVAHLNVPSLDPSGTPSSLSKPIIQSYLRNQLKFNGLVISDALNMKAVSEKYGKSEVVAKAYIAGCDLLLFPESVKEAIDLILDKLDKKELTKQDISNRCKRVLAAKYQAIVHRPMVKRKSWQAERELACKQVYEKALTCLKNENAFLPFDLLNVKTIRISVGIHAAAFRDRLDDYGTIEHHRFNTVEEAVKHIQQLKLPEQARYIVDFHSDAQRSGSNYGFGNWTDLMEHLPSNSSTALVFFGNPMVLRNTQNFPVHVKSVLCAYENTAYAQQAAAQAIMGAENVTGKLALEINEHFPAGSGISIRNNGRLKFSQPEELGINPAKLVEIDSIVTQAIRAEAMPGCQIVAAIDGKIILQKSYGKTRYDQGDSVTNDHIYDLASITKIASTTTALMALQSEHKFNIKSSLMDLVPEYVKETPYARLTVENLLTHQAGLTPWIAFYKKTMVNNQLNPEIYSNKIKEGFHTPVAAGIWIKDDYWKEILKTIVETPLTGKKSYEYSDLSYYFFNKTIEKITGEKQNEFLQHKIYAPLGLKTMTYLPLDKFPLERIVPTEFDKTFRGELIQGTVHDPGAAMMGGVAGHAGLFSNATDLAALMQFLMNKGQVGNHSLINKSVVEQYTACHFCPNNRRGLGFDKPTVSIKNGPTCDLVSPSTFGHSGFTGTITWADPENKIVYVFLSNRVYPDAENKKITKMSVRNEVQRVLYEALFDSRKK
jgi:beta-glucosidase-like glycosyl hydrolase/CubicO group peptidase (beta-lactamase class C family)